VGCCVGSLVVVLIGLAALFGTHFPAGFLNRHQQLHPCNCHTK
jgi:hypothetical protein